MKKTFMLIFLILILSGCSVSHKKYRFLNNIMSHKSNERREYKEYLGAYGEINDVYYENSPLSQIIIGVNPMNARSLKVMNNEVMVISKGEKYYLPARNESKSTVVIDVYKNGLYITNAFELYLGKVKINNTQIIDVPTIKLIKYIEIIKVNPILDGLNKDTQKTIYLGPLEDYKKKK